MDRKCGIYYFPPGLSHHLTQLSLPQLQLEVHATIIAETCAVKLRQKYRNPNPDPIKECAYTFPLYDGISVVSFTCIIGDKILRGLVRERGEAKQVYQEAKSRGETAGLLEQSLQASDVFTTSLGNVPANAEVIVEIEYVGELKHDLEADGVRFTIPTFIAPRYGNSGTTLLRKGFFKEEGISITVDVDMPEGTFIRSVESPTHPIAITMGSVSSVPPQAPRMNQASATLSLGTVALDNEFVLIVNWDEAGSPRAFLESHPTIPNQRALMTTLVPRFALPPVHPEVIFIVDRSGSMYTKIRTLISAMKVFLKSLPIGIKFNILSFGSFNTLLFPKSKTYTSDSLHEAMAHVETFQANYSGTETLAALKKAIQSRWGDVPCELMLLTDGDIWDQAEAFKYVNKAIVESQSGLRLFTLGIGNGVSHALVEGLARAGNGFSQTCTEDEKIDKKVVRMLKGGLSPHLKDCTLEVEYNETDNGFEIIDKVTDNIEILNIAEKSEERPQASISLFDNDANPDDHGNPQGQRDRFAGMPEVKRPKILQTPCSVPPLFPFTRTTLYLLLGPETIDRLPKSVTLRASSPNGPLSLKIPITSRSEPSETIHQLAARKAIQELEEGRGWIHKARNGDQRLVKDVYPSMFQDMIEREAVRLGVQYQVGGKWCSFVAVEGSLEKYGYEKQRAIEHSIQRSRAVDYGSYSPVRRFIPSARSENEFDAIGRASEGIDDDDDDDDGDVDEGESSPFKYLEKSLSLTGGTRSVSSQTRTLS